MPDADPEAPEPGRPLRQGFTTGTAAAAACKAALLRMLTGKCPDIVETPLPTGERLGVPVESAKAQDGSGWASVVKDAGDDPDATNGARIVCRATLAPWPPEGDAGRGHGSASRSPGDVLCVTIEGGQGVGRVTLPGLPVAVGEAAINPAPRAQIEAAAREALEGVSGQVRLVVEVENGREIARHTLNPRLGIEGGISILGTQGIVKPYSHAAWRATIDQSLSVARAGGLVTAAFSTGRRSERLLMAWRPDLPDLAFVQAADFFAHALREAVRRGFSQIVWGCFFGKLAKMAQGLAYTHARTEPTDFALLADLAARAGADEQACRAVRGANTARHALEIVPEGSVRDRFAALTAQAALAAAVGFARLPAGEAGDLPDPHGLGQGSGRSPASRGDGTPAARDQKEGGPSGGPRIEIVCFGFDEAVLARAYTS